MKEYHKIQSVFKRDEDGNFIVGQYSTPEIEYLKDSVWLWEEKIDGTNIRVIYEKGLRRFGGKTDNASIPAFLYEKLDRMFTVEHLKCNFGDAEEPVCLYGEGFGNKIQKVGKLYLPDSVDFALFDVRIGRWWLDRNAVLEIAQKFGIRSAPRLGVGTIGEAITETQKGFKSLWGNFDAEGLILRPAVQLFARNGERIITKLKLKDWK